MAARRRTQHNEITLKAFGIQLSGKGRQGVRAALMIAFACVGAYLIIRIFSG